MIQNTDKTETFEQWEKRWEELTSYSVERLEEMILERWNPVAMDKDEKFTDYLYARKWKINNAFEWTPENMEKLILLNQKLVECWEKLDAEAKQTLKTIKKRLDKSDNFLHDFNMEAVISAFIYVPDENGEFYEADGGIEEVLNFSMPDDGIVNSHRYHICDIDKPPSDIIYLDRKQNWNTHPQFDDKFNEHYISQAIHDLYDHTCWSFPDILRINRLWVELKVDYQNIVEI